MICPLSLYLNSKLQLSFLLDNEVKMASKRCSHIKKSGLTLITIGFVIQAKMTTYAHFEQWLNSFSTHEGFVEQFKRLERLKERQILPGEGDTGRISSVQIAMVQGTGRAMVA